MLIQMVEKMLDKHEPKEYILSKLDPPRGYKYTEMLEKDAEERREKVRLEKVKILEANAKAEAERKLRETEIKHMFLAKILPQDFDVEEVALRQTAQDGAETKLDKTVQFLTEVPVQDEVAPIENQVPTNAHRKTKSSIVQNVSSYKDTSASTHTRIHSS